MERLSRLIPIFALPAGNSRLFSYFAPPKTDFVVS